MMLAGLPASDQFACGCDRTLAMRQWAQLSLQSCHLHQLREWWLRSGSRQLHHYELHPQKTARPLPTRAIISPGPLSRG